MNPSVKFSKSLALALLAGALSFSFAYAGDVLDSPGKAALCAHLGGFYGAAQDSMPKKQALEIDGKMDAEKAKLCKKMSAGSKIRDSLMRKCSEEICPSLVANPSAQGPSAIQLLNSCRQACALDYARSDGILAGADYIDTMRVFPQKKTLDACQRKLGTMEHAVETFRAAQKNITETLQNIDQVESKAGNSKP
jgi:hypothetical protein